jgi:hypothetical protein
MEDLHHLKDTFRKAALDSSLAEQQLVTSGTLAGRIAATFPALRRRTLVRSYERAKRAFNLRPTRRGCSRWRFSTAGPCTGTCTAGAMSPSSGTHLPSPKVGQSSVPSSSNGRLAVSSPIFLASGKMTLTWIRPIRAFPGVLGRQNAVHSSLPTGLPSSIAVRPPNTLVLAVKAESIPNHFERKICHDRVTVV